METGSADAIWDNLQMLHVILYPISNTARKLWLSNDILEGIICIHWITLSGCYLNFVTYFISQKQVVKFMQVRLVKWVNVGLGSGMQKKKL